MWLQTGDENHEQYHLSYRPRCDCIVYSIFSWATLIMASPQQTGVAPQIQSLSGPSYLEWGPVWAGGLVAIAISTILLQFGAAVGLAVGDLVRADNTISYNFIAAGLWLLLIHVGSSSAAGYISGRMRKPMSDAQPTEVEFRDGIHGVTAWALATVIVASVGTITGLLASTLTVSADVPALASNIQDLVANQAVIMAFATTAASAIGCSAAWFSAVAGGNHRNAGTSHDVMVPTMFRKK